LDQRRNTSIRNATKGIGMKFNVVSLNRAIDVGTVIPMEQYNGNIGRWVEDKLEENGYSVNRKKGIDLLSLGLEVKTRKIDSTSGHTVGAMLPQDIISTEWEDSNIRDKIQKQYRVKYNLCEFTGDNLVTSARVYDFTCDEIQNNLKKSWNYCRKVLSQGNTPDYIRGNGHWGYLELQSNGYYQFRIPPHIMKKLETIATVKRTNLFEFGD
jgi:hypothetical protein